MSSLWHNGRAILCCFAKTAPQRRKENSLRGGRRRGKGGCFPAFDIACILGNIYAALCPLNHTARGWNYSENYDSNCVFRHRFVMKLVPSGITKDNVNEVRMFETLYIEVLYTIKHKIGATSGSHLPIIQDLYIYARESFGVTPEDHARLLARASEEKAPIRVLHVTVVEARDLEAKDADGFSDPYCMLGILPGSRVAKDRLLDSNQSSYSSDEDAVKGGRKESALKKFSQSFKKKKDKTARELIPARFIKSTSVKPKTLNPLWNEKFKFDLDSNDTDYLHLDIWDHDDEFSVVDAAKQLNQIAGFKGLGRYFKQIAQSARTNSQGNVDDFLGSVNVSLHDIPSTGVEKYFDLEGRSARSNVEGRILLKVKLATREDRGISEEESWSETQQHEELMLFFIDHEIRRFKGGKGEVYKWRGDLPRAALTILHQHAIQGDITDVQQAMCRLSAFARKHREHSFDWKLLYKLMEDLDSKWYPDSLTRDEEDKLADNFRDFIAYCVELICKQRDLYPPANRAAQTRLQNMLRCLAKLYEMKLFEKCEPFHNPLHHELCAVLKRSSAEHYERARNATRTSVSTDDALGSMTDLANRLNGEIRRAIQFYNPIYESTVKLNYFAVTYKQIEKMFGEDLQADLEQINFGIPEVTEASADRVTAQQMGTPLFELYLALREFYGFRDQLPSGDRKGLSGAQYYEWFKVPVQRWIAVSKFKLMGRIKKAVDLDKEISISGQVGQVDGHVKQSTSAVDVACCFGQVVDFWKSIDWPDYAGAYPFVQKITEDLCYGATYYADRIHEKLKQAGYYDEIGQFDVTEQLCITINDIEQVRRALRPLPEALKFAHIAHAVEKQQGDNRGKQARANLAAILKSADDVMIQKIKQVVDRVADKMRPDIKKFVFHLCWAPEKVKAEDAIGELMNYLDSNLVTLNTNLLRSNFDRILDSIWVEVLEEIRDVLDKEEMKQMWFFERLYDALDILVDFFHANEKGLPMSVIRNRHYSELHWELEMNKAQTKDLIARYYVEKLREQERYEENKFGTLSVRVYYNTDAEILSVEVLNARNVIPLDPNGLSDPFVLIELCPSQIFPKQTVQQTQVIKNTLNPTFDESFEFCVTAAQCRQKGAVIVFTIMDHDFFMTNDFGGEVFLSLNTIPGISGEEVSGFTALTPLTVPLTQPMKGRAKTRPKGILSALENRDWDKEAQEFAKKRRLMEAQSQGSLK
ncbi:hypothetical protein CAPTEDRAFT_226475 [Capitella teleta]|uniref:BAI1-associated protein 3 n=1 Tax=Capitella teleta TaxID=283909 RepID=R7UU63_CAPTE|nr:hypothetical protein CAPTEDRAFT_226475 [Capitella teleta]|eukprot:ELU07462.1 hypothetical protein CAPTEDRAFT_226475 [Capitella teleta]